MDRRLTSSPSLDNILPRRSRLEGSGGRLNRVKAMKLRVLDENGVAVRDSYEVRLSGWTEERYFAEAPEEGFCEFKDGELIVHSAVNIEHQEIVFFLVSLLHAFVSHRSLGKVLGGPGVLRLREGLAREPDVFFVSNERLASVCAQYAGVADFVIEVVSGGGRARDFKEKAGEYEAAGVAEYWVVDPASREVVVHRLEEGRFAVRKVTRGRLESTAVPGFRIEVEWLFERPMPSDLECLRGML